MLMQTAQCTKCNHANKIENPNLATSDFRLLTSFMIMNTLAAEEPAAVWCAFTVTCALMCAASTLARHIRNVPWWPLNCMSTQLCTFDGTGQRKIKSMRSAFLSACALCAASMVLLAVSKVQPNSQPQHQTHSSLCRTTQANSSTTKNSQAAK